MADTEHCTTPACEKDAETWALLDGEHDSYDTAASTLPTAADDATAAAEEEARAPWPSTFARSAEILAAPIVGRELVVKATASMHVLPPTKLRRNTSLKYLDRGWRTPDPASQPAALEGRDVDDEDDEEEGGVFQRMGIIKAMSMDWRHHVGGRRKLDDLGAGHRPSQSMDCRRLSKVTEELGRDDAEMLAIAAPDESADDGSKTSFVGSVCSVVNTLLGIGILSLPFVFRLAGWLGGLFALLTFGAVTWWTSILLGRALNGDPRPVAEVDAASRLRKPITSFPGIAREAFGQRGAVLLSSTMYFELFSCLAVFLVSMGEHLHSLVPAVAMTHHMVGMSLLLVAATSLFTTPRLISYLSIVGTFTTVAVVLAVFAAALWEGDVAPDVAVQGSAPAVAPPYHAKWIATGLPTSYGLVAFCFSGHAVIPSIYGALERPRQYERMISVSFVLVLACCVTVAASGYYMFGATVSDQITLSLHDAPHMDAAGALRVLTGLMVCTVFSKFSLYLCPLALGLEELVAPLVATDRALAVAYGLIKIALIAAALAVAVFVPSFGFLCSLIGLVCTVVVSVIFPAAAHLRLFGPHLRPWERGVDWLFIAGGVLLGVVGTIATV